MIWSKTTSSEEGVSRDCGSHSEPHRTAESPRRPRFPLDHRAQATWPLCGYPVTNLRALTSIQSNDSARPKSRLGDIATRVNLDQLAVLGNWGGNGWKAAGKRGNGGRIKRKELRTVVRRQKALWLSVASQQL